MVPGSLWSLDTGTGCPRPQPFPFLPFLPFRHEHYGQQTWSGRGLLSEGGSSVMLGSDSDIGCSGARETQQEQPDSHTA